VFVYLSFLAFGFDKLFGEFSFIKFYKHPVVLMGDYIKWFENNFYKDDFKRGVLLNISLFILTFIAISFIEYFIQNIIILALIGSSTIASKMLYESVKDIIYNPLNIKFLVSRDTKDLSISDINKATIETYAENLSDGVIAPLFYMLLFGLKGAFLYKVINTLDSMVGYKNDRYNNFGKFSAKLDDIANFIPSRITALLIAILMLSKKALKNIYQFGSLHESLNAGYPISAMAGVCGIALGGNTSYFGKIKQKPYFGDGLKNITTTHINKALSFQIRFEILIIISFFFSLICCF
jgi:adenosylcobinamide-phosphate synthase